MHLNFLALSAKRAWILLHPSSNKHMECPDLAFQMSFPLMVFLGKQLIPELEQRKYSMNQDYFLMYKVTTGLKNDECVTKRHQDQPHRALAGQARNNLSTRTHKDGKGLQPIEKQKNPH